jgi:nucleotide-binding universal stress UspA family protein
VEEPHGGEVRAGVEDGGSSGLERTLHRYIFHVGTRTRGMQYDSVLIATDGSEQATDAASHACDLARRHDATLHAVFAMDTENPDLGDAVETDAIRAELEEHGETALEAVAEVAAAHDVELETTLLEGEPFDAVLTYVEENDVSVIVVGRRGRSENLRVLLGSTADSILRHSSVPVFVCPRTPG